MTAENSINPSYLLRRRWWANALPKGPTSENYRIITEVFKMKHLPSSNTWSSSPHIICYAPAKKEVRQKHENLTAITLPW